MLLIADIQTPAPITTPGALISPIPLSIVPTFHSHAARPRHSPSPSLSSPFTSPSPDLTPNTVPGSGAERDWIVQDGGNYILSCAPNSVCSVRFPVTDTLPSVVNPSSSWKIEFPPVKDGGQFMTLTPDLGAPDVGVLVKMSNRSSYAFTLHLDPHASNAGYGFAYATHGHYRPPAQTPVVIDSPTPAPSTASTDQDDITEPEGLAPISPMACPQKYDLSVQGHPPFWPLRIEIDPITSTLGVWFPSTSSLPIVGVPSMGTPIDELWLDHLAMIQTAGEIDGTNRIIRVLACYPTLVLYSGFGKSMTGLILRAQGLPPLKDTHSLPSPKASTTPTLPEGAGGTP